jgi:hypothetical protein
VQEKERGQKDLLLPENVSKGGGGKGRTTLLHKIQVLSIFLSTSKELFPLSVFVRVFAPQ